MSETRTACHRALWRYLVNTGTLSRVTVRGDMMLDAYIIDRRKREREAAERPRLVLPVPEPPQRPHGPDPKQESGAERGSVEIDFTIR